MGVHRPQQKIAEERQHQRAGLQRFDTSMLSKTLQSSLFHAYTQMALAVEKVPEELASCAELCPCHYDMLLPLSMYKRHALFEKHYWGWHNMLNYGWEMFARADR